MTEVFLKVVSLSISAGILALVIAAVRPLLRRAPKWVTVLLWGMVALRLLCPFSLESSLSQVPDTDALVREWTDNYVGDVQIIHDNQEAYSQAVSAGRAPLYAGEDGFYVVTAPNGYSAPRTVGNTLIPMLSILWIVGMAAMGEYTLFSYWNLKRRVKLAIHLKENIYLSEFVESPFVFGLLRPKIYLPYHMKERDAHHVIAHERTHIQRKDHWWKPLGFTLLSIHWFNPALWLAYILLCRDIEMACDEKVAKGLTAEQRADYSQALLNCSVHHRQVAACPLAFGEGSVRERIRNVLHYKKPALWVVLLCLVLCLVVAVCFLTEPRKTDSLCWLQSLDTGSVQYIEYQAPYAEPGKQYRLYTGEQLEEAVACLRSFHGEELRDDRVEPIAGGGYQLTVVCNSGVHTLRNIANVYLVIDGTYYADPRGMLAEHFSQVFSGNTYLPAAENRDLKVSIVVEEVRPTGIDIRFENYGTSEAMALFGGNGYFLQQKEGDAWVDLPALQEAVFTTENHSLSTIRRHSINWEWLYGSLEPGHYRIGKRVSLYPQMTGEARSSVIYGEFNITSQDTDLTTSIVSPYTVIQALDADTLAGSAQFLTGGGGYNFFPEMNLQLLEILLALTPNDIYPSLGVDDPHSMITLSSEDICIVLRSDGSHVELAVEGASLSGTRWAIHSQPLLEFFTYMNQFSQENSTYEIYNAAPLEALSPYYTIEEAVIDQVVITQDGYVTNNSEIWADFWDKANHHIPATVRCMTISDRERDIYDIEFDGTQYRYRMVQDGELLEETYRYLLFFSGDAPDGAAYDAFEYFVLVNDNRLSWEQIQRSYTSSQSADHIVHRVAHRHHIYLPRRPQIPEAVQAELVLNGETFASVTDSQQVFEIWQLLSAGEWLGFEPATYFFGPRLMLLGADGSAYAIDLDVTDDLCRFGEEFYDYGPGMEGDTSVNALPQLLRLFGLKDWPDKVKAQFPELLGE